VAVGLQESRPGGDAPLPFMGRTTDKGRFRFRILLLDLCALSSPKGSPLLNFSSAVAKLLLQQFSSRMQGGCYILGQRRRSIFTVHEKSPAPQRNQRRNFTELKPSEAKDGFEGES